MSSTPPDPPEPAIAPTVEGEADPEEGDRAASEEPILDLLRPTAEESYLYERIIDALIAFLGRYVRTALTLVVGGRKPERRLLAELDSDTPELMRPLAYMAITYLLLVTVVDKLLGFASTTEFFQATSLVLSSFGEAERDTLLLAIVLPLPPVLLVAAFTHLAAGRLSGSTPGGEARLAAMMQYAVGQGLTSLIVYIFVIWALAAGADAALEFRPRGTPEQLEIAIHAGLTIAVVVGLMGAFLVSIPTVYRAVRIIEGVPTLPVGRRLIFSLLGPTIMASTIGVMLGLLAASEEMAPPTVQVSEVSVNAASAVPGGVFEGQAVLSVVGNDPMAITGVRIYWLAAEHTGFACRDPGAVAQAIRGTGREGPPLLQSDVSLQRVDGDQRGGGQFVAIDPGEFVWVTFSAPYPEGAEDRVRHWCLRTDAGAERWFDAAR